MCKITSKTEGHLSDNKKKSDDLNFDDLLKNESDNQFIFWDEMWNENEKTKKMVNDEIIIYPSNFLPDINVNVVFKESEMYEDLIPLFETYGFGFWLLNSI